MQAAARGASAAQPHRRKQPQTCSGRHGRDKGPQQHARACGARCAAHTLLPDLHKLAGCSNACNPAAPLRSAVLEQFILGRLIFICWAFTIGPAFMMPDVFLLFYLGVHAAASTALHVSEAHRALTKASLLPPFEVPNLHGSTHSQHPSLR